MAKLSKPIPFTSSEVTRARFTLRIYQIAVGGEPANCLSVTKKKLRHYRFGHELKLRENLDNFGWKSGLLEVDFKTQRLKTGNKAAGTSSGFRPFYTPNYCSG